MGGYGSTRWGWHTRKTTVEECRKLPIKLIYRNLWPGYCGSVYWSVGERKTADISYRVEGSDKPVAVRLIYTQTSSRTGEKTNLDYPVPLTTTPLPWGGARYWFDCPLIKGGVPCERRVGVIYLPPGGKYFGCRHCYDLTYRSCQESHQYDGFYKMMALQMQAEYPGCTGRDIKSILEGRFTPHMERLAGERYLRDWRDYDPHAHYLSRAKLMEQSGLTAPNLKRLEAARLLVPDTKDGRFRPKLASWGRKLAHLLANGWDVDEIKRWAQGRWSTPNPKQWPPNREEWRKPIK